MKISLLSVTRKGGLAIFGSLFLGASLQAANETCLFSLKQAVNSPERVSQLTVSAQKCPLIAELIFWIRLQKDPESASFEQIAHFIERHPDWPHLKSIQEMGEKKLTPAVSQDRILSFFAQHAPRTFRGRVTFTQALLRAGQEARAQALIQETWHATLLTPEEHHQFLERFSSYLTQEDHDARLLFLLGEKKIELAQRMIPRASQSLQQQAQVWVAFLKQDPSAITQYAALPVDQQNLEGLYLAHIAYLKKEKAFDEAIKRFLAFDRPITRPVAWWQERNYLAREMVQIQDYARAYALLQNHHLTTPKEFAEAEWFSGWLCLRFLNQPEQAKAHFYRFREVVKTPISIARAGYWLGRAYEVLNEPEEAHTHYRKASLYKTTFYGQLASHKIAHSPFPTFHDTPPVDGKSRHVFDRKEVVQAIRLLAQTGPSGHSYVRKFLDALAKHVSTCAEKQLTVALAAEVHPYAAPEIGRCVVDTSGVVLKSVYPVVSLPKNCQLEPALVMAVIHHETRFNTLAVGEAGECGLMQIMPKTAVLEAKKLGISHSPDRLFEPLHNMKLGISHLGGALSKFGGSYILGIAAYNAGATPVSRWVNEMGDPHEGAFDVADWVESIPYASVRDYTQRVLENITIYRARLGQKIRHLAHDLRERGR